MAFGAILFLKCLNFDMKARIVSTLIAYISSIRHYQYAYCLLILFLWYGNHPDIFEKKFFLNELLALVGFFFFLMRPVLYKNNDYIYNTVILILFVFSIYAVVSLLIFSDLYGYLRNTVVVYSLFSFFVGIRLYQILPSVHKLDPLFLSALLPGTSFYRTSYAASLPIYLSKYFKSCNGSTLLLIIVAMLAVKLYYGGSTSIAVILLLLILQALTRRTKMFLYIGLVVGVTVMLVFVKPYLDLLLTDETVKIDNIIRLHPVFTFDGSTTIRVFIWSYLFFEVFLNNLFGIGLGTVFISKEVTWHKLQMFIHDPYFEYTLGAHNSFLTILVRFGIIGLLPFIVLYLKLIDDFIHDKKSRRCDKVIFFYYAFFISTGCAMLNVVMESPMHASLYWGTLGMLYQAKQDP